MYTIFINAEGSVGAKSIVVSTEFQWYDVP